MSEQQKKKKKYKYDDPNKKFKIDPEIEHRLEDLVYYERPRKRFSAEIPYEIYKQLKEKAKEMEIPMSKLIVIALSDVIEKYGGLNSNGKSKGKTLAEIFKEEDELQYKLPL